MYLNRLTIYEYAAFEVLGIHNLAARFSLQHGTRFLLIKFIYSNLVPVESGTLTLFGIPVDSELNQKGTDIHFN